MSTPTNPRQLAHPATLPPLRHARRDWEQAYAAVEEWESAEAQAKQVLQQAREELAQAQKVLRGKMSILREVMNVDAKQEDIDGVLPKGI
jgi:hypothetical protein